MSALPESGWKGYGKPGHPYTTPAYEATAMHEWHAEVAEYRLRHCGETSPELLAYIVGIGETYGRE